MTLITDPDSLNDSATDNASAEVYINTTAKTVKLVKTGSLSDDARFRVRLVSGNFYVGLSETSWHASLDYRRTKVKEKV